MKSDCSFMFQFPPEVQSFEFMPSMMTWGGLGVLSIRSRRMGRRLESTELMEKFFCFRSLITRKEDLSSKINNVINC